MSRSIRIGPAPLVALVLALRASPAPALPLFSRVESAPCARCHTSPPRLNAYGIRYMLAGYRATARPAHETAPAPPAASIVGEFGASLVRADTAGAGGARGTRNTGEFGLYALDLQAAGALGRNLAYGVRAGVDSATGTVRVPVLFVQFGGLAGGALAVKTGRFETGLPFLSASRRSTRAPFLAPIAIGAEGVELLGSRTGWAAAAGLVNSERTLANAGTGVRSYSRLENTYLWAMRAFGGQLAGARVLFGRQASNIS